MSEGGIVEKATSNFIIRVPELEMEGGAVTEVVFTAADMEKVSGFQYTIEVDTDLAELLEFTPIVSGLTQNHVNLDYIEDGYFHLKFWYSNDEVRCCFFYDSTF